MYNADAVMYNVDTVMYNTVLDNTIQQCIMHNADIVMYSVDAVMYNTTFRYQTVPKDIQPKPNSKNTIHKLKYEVAN